MIVFLFIDLGKEVVDDSKDGIIPVPVKENKDNNQFLTLSYDLDLFTQ